MKELDRHAAEASAALRSEVAVDLDVDGAYDDVLARGATHGARRTLGRRLLVAAAAVLVVGAAVALVSQVPSGPGLVDDPQGDEELSAAGAAILGGLPDGPLDGRESWRLPVVAAPQSDLHDGDEVTLYGRGFEPGETIGAVHCGSEADTVGSGVGACDLGSVEGSFDHTTSGTARSDGTVVITVPVRRHITPPIGPIDCASGPERCILAIGAANDYDRSGGTYVDFADAPRFATPTFAVEPAGPYAPGQEVVARVAQLPPGRQAQILQCVGEDHCASLSQGRVADDGTYAATVVVGSSVVVEGDERPCDDDCTLRFTGIGVPDASSLPLPEPIPLELLSGESVAGLEAPATTAPPSPAPPSTGLPPVGPPSSVDPGPTTSVAGTPSDPTVPPTPSDPTSPTTAAPPTTAPR